MERSWILLNKDITLSADKPAILWCLFYILVVTVRSETSGFTSSVVLCAIFLHAPKAFKRK